MAYDVVIFGIHLTIKPIAFTLNLGSRTWDVYWYGILIALGFMLALIYGVPTPSCILRDGRVAFLFALRSPFDLTFFAAIAPPAALCAKRGEIYLLFLIGLL